MLPDSAQRISSSLGLGLSARSALAVSIIPGVQKPHWRPCSTWKPSWIGSSSPPAPRPSTVVTSRPSACTARTEHDLTGVPSSSTVQAPQPDVSQPTWVPVRPSVERRKWTSRSRGSTSAERSSPFTVTVSVREPTASGAATVVSVIVPPPLPGRSRGPESSFGEDPHDVALVVGAAPHIAARLGGFGCEPGRLLDRVVVERRAGKHLLGCLGPHVDRADAGERDPRPPDTSVVEGHVDGDADRGVIADLALELEVRPGRLRTRVGHPHGRDDLVRL